MRLVTDAEEFQSLGAQWNAVVAARGDARPFLYHQWFDAAWRWRQQNAHLWILCLFEDRSLSAVLPLVRFVRTSGYVRIRELSFLTVPDTQSCDVITAPGGEARACAAFSAELARSLGQWDVLRLAFLGPSSVAATALPRALMRVGLAPRVDHIDVGAYISLDRSWRAYSAGRHPSIQRAERRDSRRLEKAGTVGIEWLAPGTGSDADRERFVDRIIRVSARSWKAGGGSALDSAGPRAFLHRLSEVAHQRGWLSIWILTMDQEPVAMEYHLVVGRGVYALRSDFDEAFRKVSPGTYLRRRLLEEVFALGLERYYFGLGVNAHKRRWTDQAETVGQLTVYGRSWLGTCLGAWEQTLKPLARVVARRHGTPRT